MSIEVFEDTIQRIENKNNLQNHPRVIVFHEKEGRRHAHAVWSRIDAETMTAKNLPHFKLKMRDLSRDIYLEQNWKMPKGLMNHKDKDPRNFSLEEWQQAKRMSVKAQDLKSMIQECWAVSDSRPAFEHVLNERGFLLAKGDRRGFVALSPDGEVLSVSRYASKKAKEVRAKLGEPNNLPSVLEARKLLSNEMGQTLQRHLHEARQRKYQALSQLEDKRKQMVKAQQAERVKLDHLQKQRWQLETRLRSDRFQKGIKGLLDHVTGTHKRLHSQNMIETHQALLRDRQQKQTLINAQLKDRSHLQKDISRVRDHHAKLLLDLRKEKQHYNSLDRELPKTKLKPQFDRQKKREQSPNTADRLQKLRNKTSHSTDKTFDRER